MSIRQIDKIPAAAMLITVVYALISYVLFDVSVIILIKYILSQILVVFLPGYALMLLLRFKGTLFEGMAFSYAAGYGINIVEYFFVYGLNIQKYAFLFVIFTVIICFFIFFKQKNQNEIVIEKKETLVWGIFFIYLFINMISYSGNALSPTVGQGMIELSRDMQFWSSNTAALKLEFQPSALYFADSTLYYHYFSNMQLAYLSRVSGIDVFTLSFSLYPLVKCIILVGGVSYLLNIYNLKKGKFLLLLSFFFMTGYENIAVVTYVWHMIQGPFGFDIGFAFGIWFVAMFIQQWKKGEFCGRLFIPCILFWGVTTGAKGPIAVILILLPAIICLIWLLNRNNKGAFGYGIPILGIFLWISIMIVGMMRFVNHTIEGDAQRLIPYTYGQIVEEGIFNIPAIDLILTVAYKIICAHPFLAITTLVNTVILIIYIGKRKVKIRELQLLFIMLFVTIAGLLMGIFINAGGRSEMYFTMASFIPCIVFNAELMKYWDDVLFPAHGRFTKVYCIILSGVAAFGVYLFIFHSYSEGMISDFGKAYRKLEQNWEYLDYTSFSRDEALACLWIKDNSDETSIIISDRNIDMQTRGGLSRNTYYSGIFSERQHYVEAIDLINVIELKEGYPYQTSLVEEAGRRIDLIYRMYQNDIAALNQLKTEGVDYIIQNDTITPGFDPNADSLKLVFYLGNINVYEII